MNTPRTIGIVGGMSPESTVTYYQHIVHRHQAEFHDHRYPRILVASVSFQEYMDWQHSGDWLSVARGLEKEFHSLAAAGAEFAVLATNTMHKVLPDCSSPIPILTIFQAVASDAAKQGWRTLGLTGTKFTMNADFYRDALTKAGMRVVLPEPKDREEINRMIYSELIEGVVRKESVGEFQRIRKRLMEHGADTVLLGCTELQMLVSDDDSGTPVLDSARAHADMAWRIAVGKEELPSKKS